MSQEILLADYSKKLDQQYSEAHSQKKANTDFVNDKSGYCNIDYFHDLNLSSLVLFSWKAKKDNLNTDSLGIIKPENSSSNYCKQLNSVWLGMGFCKIKIDSLTKTFFREYLWKLIFLTLSAIFIFLLELLFIFAMDHIITYFGKKEKDRETFDLIKMSSLLVASRFCHLIFQKQYKIYEKHLSLTSVLKLNCFIYDKIFKIAYSSKRKLSSKGEIINFLFIDSQKLGKLIEVFPLYFLYPIKIGIYGYLIYFYLGSSFIIGLFFIFFCNYMNYILLKGLPIMKEKFLQMKDNRLKSTAETLDKLKIIKMYCWENIFKNKILEDRIKELDIGRMIFNLEIKGILLIFFAPHFTTLSTLGIYQYINESINVNSIFLSLYLFEQLKEPLRSVISLYSKFIENYISLRRIETFIREEEKEVLSTENDSLTNKIISVDNLSFSYGKNICNNVIINQKLPEKNKLHEDQIPECILEEDCVLNNISLNINKGELVGLFGEIGSGKSSLIHAIMNNLISFTNEDPHRKPFVNGSISYYGQNPLIINESIKNNILFFTDFNSKRYNDTIEVCELIEDISSFPEKDKTKIGDIGEKSIGLSGGQRARVSLARAVYSNREIYLFDDPFSALDKNVADKIFNKCVLNFLKNSTRIIALHNLKYLKYFDRIVWLFKGTIIFNGIFNDLIKEPFFKDFVEDNFEDKFKENNSNQNQMIKNIADGLFDNLCNIDSNINYKLIVNDDFIPEHKMTKPNNKARKKSSTFDLINSEKFKGSQNLENPKARKSTLSIISVKVEKNDNDQYHNRMINGVPSKFNKNSDKNYPGNYNDIPGKNHSNNLSNKLKPDNPNRSPLKNTRQSAESKKNILGTNLDVFHKYIAYMGGNRFLFIVICCTFVWQIFTLSTSLLAAEWTRNSSDEFSSIENRINNKNFFYFCIYFVLQTGSCFANFLLLWVLGGSNLESGQFLHKDILSRLLNAPINHLLDFTSKGELLNILSKDLENVYNTHINFGDLLIFIFQFIGCIFIICKNQVLLLIIPPILVKFSIEIYKFFINANRDLMRLEGLSRAKILTLVSETIDAKLSICLYNRVNIYKEKFYKIIDENMKINIFINGCFVWLGLYIELAIVVFLAILLVFIVIFQNVIDAQVVALILLFIARLQRTIINVFLTMLTFENDMISMERCSKYLNIPQEMKNEKLLIEKKTDHKYSHDNIALPKNAFVKFKTNNWPNNGGIKFSNCSVKYRPDSPFVLKNLTFEIKAGEKIGIIGRTGCGKSTVVNCLLRMTEPYEGKILIDGEDIISIELDHLRKSLTIIPQDPCIFNGSLRFNLDPSNNFSDERILEVLKILDVSLTDNIKGIYQDLDENNLSIGEKQIVSLARAILRNSKIVVMDEATANIDFQTEEKIQNILMRQFKKNTIVTIAHRINTLMSYDKILVLDKGEIAEFDEPGNLLNNQNSLFFKLYNDTKLTTNK